jgi:hypothetical protein
MPKSVSGFLANDGSFFENEPECQRYEAMQQMTSLCETHETNFENFLGFLNAWHTVIKEYYDADTKCKEPYQGNGRGRDPGFDDAKGHDDYDIQSDDVPAFLPTEGDNPHTTSGDKDAPGFLEQSFRRRK